MPSANVVVDEVVKSKKPKKTEVLRKGRTGEDLFTRKDWSRTAYKAGVKRHSAAVRMAMRLKARHEVRNMLKSIIALLQAGRHKMVNVEDLRLVCKLQGRPLLVAVPTRRTPTTTSTPTATPPKKPKKMVQAQGGSAAPESSGK